MNYKDYAGLHRKEAKKQAEIKITVDKILQFENWSTRILMMAADNKSFDASVSFIKTGGKVMT